MFKSDFGFYFYFPRSIAYDGEVSLIARVLTANHSLMKSTSRMEAAIMESFLFKQTEKWV